MSDSNTPDSTEYLRLIWGEMKSLNGRIENTNERLDTLQNEVRAGFRHTHERIDQTNERLDHLSGRVDHLSGRVDHLSGRVDFLAENQLRTTTAVVELQKGMTLLAEGQREHTLAILALQGETRTLHQRIDQVLTGTVGRKVNDLDERLHRVEQHLGLDVG